MTDTAPPSRASDSLLGARHRLDARLRHRHAPHRCRLRVVRCADRAQPSALALLVQLLTVGVIFRVAEVKKVIRDVATVVLIVSAVGIALVWISGAEGTWVKVLMATAAVVFYGVAPAAVIGHQIHRNVIDAQTIFAVVSAYILIGMFFTFAYVLASVEGNIFKGEGVGSLSEVLFFSFTSLSTTDTATSFRSRRLAKPSPSPRSSPANCSSGWRSLES